MTPTVFQDSKRVELPGVAEALNLMAGREKLIEQANNLPTTGKFLVVAQTAAGVAFLEIGRSDDRRSASFIMVAPGTYSRLSYEVDCEAQKASRELYARFDATGLIQVEGATPEAPFAQLSAQGMLKLFCGLGRNPTGATYTTVSEALSAANVALRPSK